jgi:hypothetical protein
MTSRDTRDMFAAVALEVMLTRNLGRLPDVAAESYEIAEAMMAERKQRDIARQHGEPTIDRSAEQEQDARSMTGDTI